jgi:hypothetical protein
MVSDTLFGNELLDVRPDHGHENQEHEDRQTGNGNNPEEREIVVQAVAVGEVLAKISGDKCKWCEEDRDHRLQMEESAHV